MRGVRVVAAGAAVAGLAVAWAALRGRDEAAIAADPEYAQLSLPRDGRPIEVDSVDGTRLHAEVFGPEDAPTIVLVHGWSVSRRMWGYQLDDLAESYRVVTYDHRGHGRSGLSAAGDYSTQALASDLDAVLRATVPPGERVVLVGHSMGGMAVAAWSEVHPEDVRRLVAGVVFVDTGMRGLVAGARVAVIEHVPAPVRTGVARFALGLAVKLPSRRDPFLNAVMRYIALSAKATPGQVAFCTEMVLDCPPRVRAGFGVTLTALDVVKGLQHFDVPAVVIVGTKDRLTPPPQARAIADAVPGSMLVELPGHGHMGPLEAPEPVTSHIRDVATRTLPSRA